MLQKQFRLKKQIEFNATYKQRRIVSNDFLIAYIGKPKTNQSFSTKIGIVVSKKLDKRAVKRNRIRRLISEAYRIAIKNNEINPKWISIIFIPKEIALETNYNKVYNAVITCLNKADKKYA